MNIYINIFIKKLFYKLIIIMNKTASNQDEFLIKKVLKA
jgi:hypothetical protein